MQTASTACDSLRVLRDDFATLRYLPRLNCGFGKCIRARARAHAVNKMEVCQNQSWKIIKRSTELISCLISLYCEIHKRVKNIVCNIARDAQIMVQLEEIVLAVKKAM